MANLKNSPYRSFGDLLLKRYNASEEQIKKFLEADRRLVNNFVLQNAQSKLDILTAFDVSLDEIAENPNFLLLKTNEIFTRCKVAKLAGLYIDSELLNCPAPTIDIVNNYIAHSQGNLINENDIFAPIEEAAMFGEIPEEEYLATYNNKNEKAAKSYSHVSSIFKRTYPELYKELNQTVFSAVKADNSAANEKSKRPVDPRKLELKEKIRAIYARDDSSLGNKHRAPSPTLQNLEERTDVVYSVGEDLKNRPFEKLFAYSEQVEETTTPTNTSPAAKPTHNAKSINTDSSKEVNQTRAFAASKETLTPSSSNMEAAAEKNTESPSDNQETKAGQIKNFKKALEAEKETGLRKAREFAWTYRVSLGLVFERQKVCEELFGLTEEDFYSKLNYSGKILTCPIQDLHTSKTLLTEVVGLDEKYIPLYTRKLELPIPELVASKSAEKIQMLAKYNITLDDLSQNFAILTNRIDRLEIRAKLAFINGLPLDTFIEGGCRCIESVLWARMQAYKNGITSTNKYYIIEEQYKPLSGVDTSALMEQFPLDENVIAIIDEMYNQKLASGASWKKSFKLRQLENSQTTKTTIETNTSNSTAATQSNPAKTIEAEESQVEKISNEAANANTFTPATSYETMSKEHKDRFMLLLACSEKELERAVKVYPEILGLNPSIPEKLKQEVCSKYAITEKEFAKALRTAIDFANRTPEDIETFEAYCKEYLLFSDEQFKELLIKAPEMIGRNREELYKRACIIAQELNAPFPQVTATLIRCKRLYTSSTETLSSKLKKLKTIFTKDEILAHPNAVAVNENSVKLRYMLNIINGESTEEFLDRNYLTRETKIFARTMVNFINGLKVNVYNSADNYAIQLKNALALAGRDTTINFNEDVDEQIMNLYPLGEVQMKQIERIYNDKNSSRRLELTVGELENGK